MQNNIQLVIFDFDGTLADTQTAIVEAYQKTLSIMGLPVISRKEVEGIIGVPIVEGFKISVPMDRNKEAVDLYHNLFKEAIASVKTFYGVKETLQNLKENGIRMAVASSRGMESLTKLCNSTGLMQYFEIICGWDCVKNPKPAPDLVIHILEKLGEKAENTLVVGDAIFDLQMGKRAGCRVCGVSYGNHPKERLLEENPDILIDSFGDILGHLSKGAHIE